MPITQVRPLRGGPRGAARSPPLGHCSAAAGLAAPGLPEGAARRGGLRPLLPAAPDPRSAAAAARSGAPRA